MSTKPIKDYSIEPKLRALTETQKKFLKAVVKNFGNISLASKQCKINPDNHYQWCLKTNARYSQSYVNALAMARVQSHDAMEAECYRRAFLGYKEEVYQRAQLVGYKTKYDSSMAMALLKADMPEKYQERITLEAPGGGPLLRSISISFNQLVLDSPDHERLEVIPGELVDE